MSKSQPLPSPEFIHLDARVQLGNFLGKVKKMIKDQAKIHLKSLDSKQLKTITHPQIFLSYAWEEKPLQLEGLQSLLKIIKEDFENAGLRPWLDLAQMTGELDEKMRLGIQSSQYVLLIGTHRYAARTQPGSNTNVYKELQFTLEEYKRRSSDPERADFLLPLMLEGNYNTTFPLLLNQLIRDGRSWYNFEKNEWQSIDNYIKGLTEYEPVGIIPCLLGLTRLNDYPAYREACVEKYKDLQKLLMLELNLKRSKFEKQEFENQKQELQKKQEELKLSLENSQVDPSSFEKESRRLRLKLNNSESLKQELSEELAELQSKLPLNKNRINEIENELNEEISNLNKLQIQYEKLQQKMQPSESFKKQKEELDIIQAQLALREEAIKESEKSLKAHQEKLEKQAAEEKFAIKEQIAEIKKSIETTKKLKPVDVTESPIPPKFSIKPWRKTEFKSDFVSKAEDVELKKIYMCPVEKRPLYDAVTLQLDTGKGYDEEHTVSDEAARNWLIVGQNSTCPCCRLPVKGITIPRLLRDIVEEQISEALKRNSSPLPETKSEVSLYPEKALTQFYVNSTYMPEYQKNINQLLQFVAEGEQEKAEKLIQKDESLVLCVGMVKDLSGREFKYITAFQYALWAVDWHMWTMIQKYLPEQYQIAQWQALETYSTAYGKHFTLTGLTSALQHYVDNAVIPGEFGWASNQEEAQYWCKIGIEQKLLPAHVVNEYCRTDRAFYPCPQEWTSQLPRTRETASISWFTPIASGVELGLTYAFYRYNSKQCVPHEAPKSPYSKNEPARATEGMGADLKALQSLWNARTQQLKLLKSKLRLPFQLLYSKYMSTLPLLSETTTQRLMPPKTNSAQPAINRRPSNPASDSLGKSINQNF